MKNKFISKKVVLHNRCETCGEPIIFQRVMVKFGKENPTSLNTLEGREYQFDSFECMKAYDFTLNNDN